MTNDDKRYNITEYEAYISAHPDKVFELINGKIVEKSISEEHGKIIINIGAALKLWQKTRKIKGHYSTQASHRLVDDDYNVRCPDVSFRYTDNDISSEKLAHTIPDFAVEVKSHNEDIDSLRKKASFYIENNVRLVWLIYPQIRVVEARFPDGSNDYFQLAEQLSGDKILPDFQITLTEIFSKSRLGIDFTRYDFTWRRGYQLNEDRLLRMKANFLEPNKLPPVAWFMGGIEYYESIRSYQVLSTFDLSTYLLDTGGGIRSFGRLKIWVEWFHHILPFLIKKSFTDGGFMWNFLEFFEKLYPHNIFEEYFGFKNDIFDTLMQIIMQDSFWKDNDLKKPVWAEELDKWKPEWYEDDTLYACLEFCIKYLDARAVPHWVKSITDIEGEIWTIQVRHWVKKLKKSPASYNIPYDRAQYFLTEIRQYSAYADI